MRQHVVTSEPKLIFGDSHQPSVGVLLQTHAKRHPIPWDHIDIGDQVWIKWRNGPIVSHATVSGVRQLTKISEKQLQDALGQLDTNNLRSANNRLPTTFNAIIIRLANETWLEPPVLSSKQNQRWRIFNSPDEFKRWGQNHDLPFAPQTTRNSRQKSRAITAIDRFLIFRRDSFTCFYCGIKAPHTVLTVMFQRSSIHEEPRDSLRTICEQCAAANTNC